MTEVLRTKTHAFYIAPGWNGSLGFTAEYRPLNPKTGLPWQASRRINEQADVAHQGWEGRPNAYSTEALALAAVERQAAKLSEARRVTITATYAMPAFTSRADAEALATPHGLTLASFALVAGEQIAIFTAATLAAVHGLSADLDYAPISIRGTR